MPNVPALLLFYLVELWGRKQALAPICFVSYGLFFYGLPRTAKKRGG